VPKASSHPSGTPPDCMRITVATISNHDEMLTHLDWMWFAYCASPCMGTVDPISPAGDILARETIPSQCRLRRADR
jgi:hypothetical protein